MEGKSNKQGIRWGENQFVWCGLKLKPIIDLNNPVMMHGLTSKVKYVRILFKIINGKRRWFAQLINEGIPYKKPANSTQSGVVGLDLNVSNIAYVADDKAGLLTFAEGVPTFQQEISRIQSQMQRSQRNSNPDNYEPDFIGRKGRKKVVKKGKNKKRCASVGFPDHESATRQGRLKWHQSKRYQKLRVKKRELERRKSEYAQSQNRKLVNDILRHGNQIKTEKVSVKGWQKRYGKAIAAKSPGFFQSELNRKAESANGSFYEFSTRKTALSQTHLTGERIKKSLSERVHYDRSGVVMHRDLMSAFLSRHVHDDSLSLLDAQTEYQGMESTLLQGWQEYLSGAERYESKSANRVIFDESRCGHSPVEQICSYFENANQIDDLRSGRKVS